MTAIPATPPLGDGLTGDDLRRHLRDHHGDTFDVPYLRIGHDHGLAWEHKHDHEDGADHEHSWSTVPLCGRCGDPVYVEEGSASIGAGRFHHDFDFPSCYEQAQGLDSGSDRT